MIGTESIRLAAKKAVSEETGIAEKFISLDEVLFKERHSWGGKVTLFNWYTPSALFAQCGSVTVRTNGKGKSEQISATSVCIGISPAAKQDLIARTPTVMLDEMLTSKKLEPGEIPPSLKMWLECLSDREAEKVWAWFDEEPCPSDNVIGIIAESHKKLTKRLTQDDA